MCIQGSIILTPEGSDTTSISSVHAQLCSTTCESKRNGNMLKKGHHSFVGFHVSISNNIFFFPIFLRNIAETLPILSGHSLFFVLIS